MNETLCEQYIKDNPEVISGFTLTITGREQAALRLLGCRGALRVRAFLDNEMGGARRLVADIGNVSDVTVSLQSFNSLAAGQNHVLTWVIDGPTDDWQLVSELTLDGTVHYRHLKVNRPGVMNAEMLMIKVRP